MKMLTQLLACSFTILAAEPSYEKNPSNAALERCPVMWFVVYLCGALLLLLLLLLTCASCRERADSKAPLGIDLVERGVLHGEKPAGPCEWLSRRWPWSPRPLRSPQLSRLRMGLARSTQPVVHYQLIEKRHVHFARGALCVLRMDLKELQELAEKENTNQASPGGTGSGEVTRRLSYAFQRRTLSGSPIERFASASGSPTVQLGTVEPVDSRSQPLFRTLKSLESGNNRVSWSPSTGDVTSDAEFLEDRGLGEPHHEDIPVDSLVVTDVNAQRHGQISNTNFGLDVRSMDKWGVVGETTNPNETADTEGKDASQPPTIVTEETTRGSDHVTAFKNVVKARSYIDIHRKEAIKLEPTTSLENTRDKRDSFLQYKVRNATDLEQTSDSDVLAEISAYSEDSHTDVLLRKESQEHDSMSIDQTVLDKQFKTFRYTSAPTGEPESLPSQKEVPPVIANTITQSPSVYLSVLDKDAPKLPKHTLAKEETEGIHNANSSVSSCFMHTVSPLPQQECLQFNKRNSSKSERYSSLHPDRDNSVQHLQNLQQTEYKVAPASVETTDNTFFTSSNRVTKGQNVRSSGRNVAAEEGPGLQTTWDLLHSFPCPTDTVQTLRMDTRSELNPVSDSYNGFKEHDENSVYLSCKGYDVPPTKQQESGNTEGVTSDSRHMWPRADQYTSTLLQKPSPFRPEFTPVSDSEAITRQQHRPLPITISAGEHKVLQWRITVNPRLFSSSKGHNKIPDQVQNQH